MKTYKDLNVYKRAYQVAIDLHLFLNNKESSILPQYKSDIRRVSRQVLHYIAESFAQREINWKRSYNFKAINLIRRLILDLDFLHDVKNVSKDEYEYFISEYDICIKQLYKLNFSFKEVEHPETVVQ